MIKRAKLPNMTFNFLVMPYEGRYMAMCRETGLIRDGRTLAEAQIAIEAATKTLLEAISQDQSLLPSLSVGLPLRYTILFNWTVMKMLLHYTVHNLLFLRQNVHDFEPRLA